MGVVLTKQLAVVEDLALGIGQVVQERNNVEETYTLINAAAIPYSTTQSITEKIQALESGSDLALQYAYEAEATKRTAASYAVQPEGELVRQYISNGDGSYSYSELAGVYSALHYESVADSGFQESIWNTEALRLTAASYAVSDTDVIVYTSNGDGTFTETVQTGVSSAKTLASQALTSAGLAKLWAEEDEDVEVESGKYSAKHHATKAAASAASIEPTVVSNKLPVSSQLDGTYALTNTVKTLGVGKFLYTGNGASQEIDIGLSSLDLTNQTQTLTTYGLPVFHDRANVSGVGGDCIMVDSSDQVVESGSLAFKDYGVDGIIKVHIKSRSNAGNHRVVDGLRGGDNRIYTDLTNVEDSSADILFFTNGFSVSTDSNTSLYTYVAYIELYTHLKWGLTNQGKRYIEAYNPDTNMGMIMYEGSGVVGHQIPHSLGVELDYWEIKDLDIVKEWRVEIKGKYAILNDTAVFSDNDNAGVSTIIDFTPLSGTQTNNSNETYVAYYKAKSKVWTCGTYNGTGADDNFVETRDNQGNARKPHEVIIKCIYTTGDWGIYDNKRLVNSEWLELNTANSELTNSDYNISLESTGVNLIGTTEAINGIQQYFYQAYLLPEKYDTDLDGYFDNESDTTSVELTDGKFSISSGFGANGVENEFIDLETTTITPTNGWED